MKYAFFGSPRFAEIILRGLIEHHYIPTVLVCNPDKPVGRKHIITPPPTKVVARDYPSITVLQPDSKDAMSALATHPLVTTCDIAIVAAYARIIPKTVLEAFKMGVIGVHPSLLPRHRGASPIQQTILDGDVITGVTLYRMDEFMDHGPMYAQKELLAPIDRATYQSLIEDLGALSVNMLLELIPLLENNVTSLITQDESRATCTKKFTTDDGFVDMEKDSPVTVDRKIRALNPDPGAYTIMSGKRTKLISGTINTDGFYTITSVIPEGKKEQRVSIVVPPR